MDHVGRALKRDIRAYTETPATLTDPELVSHKAFFATVGVQLPSDKPGWARWFERRDAHKADALYDEAKLRLSDRLAIEDPKRFYRQITKSTSSAQIRALHTPDGVATSDADIEHHLTEYLRHIGEKTLEEEMSPEANHTPPCTSKAWKRKRAKHSAHLANIMKPIAEDQMMRIIRTCDSTSSPGIMGIAPALLKAVTTRSWVERVPRTEDDDHTAALHRKFSIDFEQMRQELDDRDRPDPLRGPRPDNTDPYILQTREPLVTRDVLLRALNLCLASRDIPGSEKISITTGLPKNEGLVNSTDDLRPISVGPGISRLLNKIMADRLSGLLVRHDVLDKAQFAFLPGGDVHGPISATLTAYRDRAKHQKPCYAIFYDISKAYDTIRWTSIRTAMTAVGLPTAFTEFVMNSLKGTMLAMRTNVPGNITPRVEMHKAIKQGCPLAPLLFVIVMDELHCALRERHEGYALGIGYKGKHKIQSRGYCDDTCVMSTSLADLTAMNKTVHEFFTTHGLRINSKKTKVTGRNADQTPFTGTILWPGNNERFDTIPPDKPIKYLGAHITLDLDWTTHTNKLNALVITTAHHLNNGRLSLLQAASLIKYVTGPRMEIGMRHADIALAQLQKWDKILASALANRAGMASDKTHESGIAISCRLHPLTNQYLATKMAYAMELLTRKSELRDHHTRSLGTVITAIHKEASKRHTPTQPRRTKPNKGEDSGMTAALQHLAKQDIRITPNKQGKSQTFTAKVRAARPAKQNQTITVKGVTIPIWNTHDLWGTRFDHAKALADAGTAGTAPTEARRWLHKICAHSTTTKHYHHPDCNTHLPSEQHHTATMHTNILKGRSPHLKCTGCRHLWPKVRHMYDSLVHAQVCTDGSTYPGKPSAAAYTYIEDNIRSMELWDMKGFYWTIHRSDNYEAELAAIHKAIRSIPVNVRMTIHTDSLSAIQAIHKFNRAPHSSNSLRLAGRPYILAISRAMEARKRNGAATTLSHVRSHTGGRDKPSIGNAEADRLAKWEAAQPTYANSAMDMMAGDLKYVIATSTWTQPDDGGPPTEHLEHHHGDVRELIRTRLQSAVAATWAKRPKRGAMIRDHPTLVQAAIKNTWNEGPSSASIRMLMTCLHQVTPKVPNNTGYAHEKCGRCGTGAARTPHHRTWGCPCNTLITAAAYEQIDNLMGFCPDPDFTEHDGPTPTDTGPYPNHLTTTVQDNRKELCNILGGEDLPGRSIFYQVPAPQKVVTLDKLADVGCLALLLTLAKPPNATPQEPPGGESAPSPTASDPTPAGPSGKATPSQDPLPRQLTHNRRKRQRPHAPDGADEGRGLTPEFAEHLRKRKAAKATEAKALATALDIWGPQAGQVGASACFTCGKPRPGRDTCMLHGACEAHRTHDHRGAATCTTCTADSQTGPSTAPTTMKLTLYRLITATATAEPHLQAPAVRQACRAALNTHSDLHLNPFTDPNPWNSTWHTQDRGLTLFGGTYEATMATFLRDRYTWICPSRPRKEEADLKTTIGALMASTGPARAAMLMHDCQNIHATISKAPRSIRHHTIAHYPPGSIKLHSSNTLILHSSKTTTNARPMVLVLLETNNPPEINSTALGHHLKTTSSPPDAHTFHRIPWEHPPATGTIHGSTVFTMKYRI